MPNNQVLRNMFMCGGKFTFHFKKPLFCVFFFFYPLELVLVSAFQFRNSGSRPLKSLKKFSPSWKFWKEMRFNFLPRGLINTFKEKKKMTHQQLWWK